MSSEPGCAPVLIVRAEDWPYGLRCGECSRVLEDGDSYAESLTGMIGDTPMVKIVCCLCGGQHTTFAD